MSKSKIEWTDRTWNPVTGCTKISPGCDHCYAERMAHRLAHIEGSGYGNGIDAPNPVGAFDVKLRPERLDQPLSWRKPSRVFVCSMGDLFHKDVPDSFLDEVFHNIIAATHLRDYKPFKEGTPPDTFIILTKRHERMLEYTSRPYIAGNLKLMKNIIGMVTAENQHWANIRVPFILQSSFAVKGVSIEPMLGPVDIVKYIGSNTHLCRCGWHETQLYIHPSSSGKWFCPTCETYCQTFPGLNLVICGGESGHGARPMHPDWVRNLRDQCQDVWVPFFFKQWGEYVPGHAAEMFGDRPGWCKFQNGAFSPSWDIHFGTDVVAMKVGKKNAGRQLDGEIWEEFPVS